MLSKNIKVASCQIKPALQQNERKKQFLHNLEKAHSNQIDFICFPEGFITGYYADETLARQNSFSVADEEFVSWLNITKNFTPTVIIGFNEKDGCTLYDAAAVIEDGKLLDIQRKHHLYHKYFTPGNDFTVINSKGITLGVIICLDINYFEPSRILAKQGASIIFVPMCNRVNIDHSFAKRPLYYIPFVTRSFENRSWIVTSDWVWHYDGSTLCPGNSVIYNSDGQEVARSEEYVEQLLTYLIPLDSLQKDKGIRFRGSDVLAKELAKTT